MSLTSYRTAPSRVKSACAWKEVSFKTQSPACQKAGAGRSRCDPGGSERQPPESGCTVQEKECLQEGTHLAGLCRPGSDLLSHALRRSTIGARGLNDGVRDGIRWNTLSINTPSNRSIFGRLLDASTLLRPRTLCVLRKLKS